MKPDRSLAPPTRLDHPSRGWRDAAPKGATGARTGTRETIADEDRLDGADAPRHDHDLGTENTSAVNRVTNTRLTVTVSQAAELLGVSTDTVRRWAESGRLKSTVAKDGRRLFDGEDIADAAISS